VFPNDGDQKHLVRDTKGQWDSKDKNVYRAESERVMCEVG